MNTPAVAIQRKKGTKRIRIHLKDQHSILVTAPYRCPRLIIDHFVKSQSEWIQTQLKKLGDLALHPPERSLTSGQLSYLGQDYTLDWTIARKSLPQFSGDQLHLSFPSNNSEKRLPYLKTWFRKQGKEIFEDRVAIYATMIKVSPKEVKVRHSRSRWGSCTAKGVITFTERLLCAPLSVIDGIVVHELCHLVHLNHSREFWELVAKYDPDYKTDTMAWTNQHHALLRYA